jgi:hypothetical protein
MRFFKGKNASARKFLQKYAAPWSAAYPYLMESESLLASAIFPSVGGESHCAYWSSDKAFAVRAVQYRRRVLEICRPTAQTIWHPHRVNVKNDAYGI